MFSILLQTEMIVLNSLSNFKVYSIKKSLSICTVAAAVKYVKKK